MVVTGGKSGPGSSLENPEPSDDYHGHHLLSCNRNMYWGLLFKCKGASSGVQSSGLCHTRDPGLSCPCVIRQSNKSGILNHWGAQGQILRKTNLLSRQTLDQKEWCLNREVFVKIRLWGMPTTDLFKSVQNKKLEKVYSLNLGDHPLVVHAFLHKWNPALPFLP